MADRVDAGEVNKAAVAGSKDRFEDLPEHVLEMLLSLLPARDVVRSSVLARRWRTLWKSVPALSLNPSEFGSAQVFNNFVNTLLEHRDRTSRLRECDILPYPLGQEDDAHRHVESWVQYAVSCGVSMLRVQNWRAGYSHLKLSNSSVISKDLKRLELYNLAFDESPLDVIRCEALEVLEIDECSINVGDIFPKSLHHLKIRGSSLYSMDTQRINRNPEDTCTHAQYLGDCGDESCEGCYGEDDRSLLLEGLAGATNLELISECSLTFRKDLKWCPMYSKLKTVLLNDWCLTANFAGLLYFLQHTPILEKLTLQLPSGEDFDPAKYSVVCKYLKAFEIHCSKEDELIQEKLTLQLPSCKDFDIGSSGSYTPAEYFLVSKHLKVVEIHCNEEDELINQIVDILGIHGVTSAQISIKHDSWNIFGFSFEQTE